MPRSSPGALPPGGSGNRRNHERVHAVVPIAAVHDGLLVHIEAQNISQGGAYCLSDARFDVMTRLAVSIDLPARDGDPGKTDGYGDLDPGSVQIEAVVVRCEPHPFLPGRFSLALFFPHLEETVRERVAIFVRGCRTSPRYDEPSPGRSDG